MVFIEQSAVLFQIIREQFLNHVIIIRLIDDFMPAQNAVRIGINDKNRFPGCIQNHGISGLRPDPLDGQQFFPQECCRLAKEQIKITIPFFVNQGKKILQTLCLDIIIPCRPNIFGQLFLGKGRHCRKGQQTVFFQVGNGPFNIFPIGILGQNGPDHDFKWSLPGPPVRGAEKSRETFIHALKQVAGIHFQPIFCYRHSSPRQIPMSRAVSTLSLVKSTIFRERIASSRGTEDMTGGFQATI